MHLVTEIFPEHAGPLRTRVCVTETSRKEYEHIKHVGQAELFQGRADKGFKGYVGPMLRWEGDGPVWGFGSNEWTTRICGYFQNDETRKNFVLCGVWDGKPGSRKRPPSAEPIVDRAEKMKKEGVRYPPNA